MIMTGVLKVFVYLGDALCYWHRLILVKKFSLEFLYKEPVYAFIDQVKRPYTSKWKVSWAFTLYGLASCNPAFLKVTVLLVGARMVHNRTEVRLKPCYTK